MEETRQREEEAKALLEEEAKGKAQWAMVQEKLEQDREVRSSGCLSKTDIYYRRLLSDHGDSC